MILSRANLERANVLMNALPEQARRQILNASVKLRGTTRSKDTFVGSGVIFNVEGNSSLILTAKHNLHIFYNGRGDKESELTDEMLTDFQENVEIYYAENMAFGTNPGQTGNGAKIYEAKPIFLSEDREKEKPWTYDVMVLRSIDKKLLKYANHYAIMNHDKVKEMANDFYEDHFGNGQTQFLDRKRYQFIQTGFGKKKETRYGKTVVGVAGKYESLQYRLALPKAAVTTTVYEEKTPYKFAILLDGKVDSTAPGDSGGPLLAIEYCPALFELNDIKDAALLVRKLKTENELSKTLKKMFSDKTQNLLQNPNTDPQDLTSDLVNELNHVIEEKTANIFTEELLRSLNLSDETKHLLKMSRCPKNVVTRRNRMILEDVYPDEIKKLGIPSGKPDITVYLVGVTMGVDYDTSPQDDKGKRKMKQTELDKVTPFFNCVSTAVMPYYEKLLREKS